MYCFIHSINKKSIIFLYFFTHTNHTREGQTICHKVFPLAKIPKPIKAIVNMSPMLLGGIHCNPASLKILRHNPIVKEQ